MKRSEKILLDYVIKKSYNDNEAQDVLNAYDAERTKQEYSSVALVNSLIRCGNTRLARRIVESMTGQAVEIEE